MAVRETPNVEITGLVFDPDGTARVTVQGDSPASLTTTLQQRISTGGLVAEMGELRTGGGRPTAEFRIRAR
jgi:hypothetical protein